MSNESEMYEGYAVQDFEREEWWLAAPEHLLVWARLRNSLRTRKNKFSDHKDFRDKRCVRSYC